MKQPTRTINRLHFSDLDPMRFEDLCLNLVTRLENWKEINHFGRKGSDGGVDIFAIKNENDKDIHWIIQCKRYISISKANITEIVDKVSVNSIHANKLLVIVSCDVSKALYHYLKDYSAEKGISETELWTASILESKLYNDYKDLLFIYFGIRLENKTKDNIAKIKHSLRMEKRVFKELIDHKFIKENNNIKLFMFNPSARFISSEVFIRSIDDTSYPEAIKPPKGQISPWFKTYFYNTYHNGIEFWLDAVIGTTVIMDEDGFWEPLTDYYDKRKENPKYRTIRAKEIGRIPFYNIVDFKTDGDEYSSDPQIFCKFDINGMPYEEIYYKSHGDPKKEIADWEFDKEKRKIFPK